ncbi:MAG: hypothetical protein ACR2M1_01350 [Gemmatimonadaceae bacterium]
MAAAGAVRAIPTQGGRAIDGIKADDLIDAVRSKLLSPIEIDALAAPDVLHDPTRSRHVVHVARSIYQDGIAKAVERDPRVNEVPANAAGVRALVMTLGARSLEAAVRRDGALRHACLWFGSAARCRVAVSTAIDAGTASDMNDVRGLARDAVSQLAVEPGAPAEAGAVIVNALRMRESVCAVAKEVADYSRGDGHGQPLPPALEGMLLGALRHGTAWQANGKSDAAQAHRRAAFDLVKHDALCATSDLVVLDRAVRSDVAPLIADDHAPALRAALRIHSQLTAEGRVSGRTLTKDAVVFDIAREIIESETAPLEPEYTEAVTRMAGAALATTGLYRNARGGEALVRSATAFMDSVSSHHPAIGYAESGRWKMVQHFAAEAISARLTTRVGDAGATEDGTGHLKDLEPSAAERTRIAMLRGLDTESVSEDQEVTAPTAIRSI